MAARSLGRRTGRQGRRAFVAAVQAQLECQRSIVGSMGGECKPAKRDKKALHGNGISDDDPDDGSTKLLGPSAKSAHAHAMRKSVSPDLQS
jgi:hypothetical protein